MPPRSRSSPPPPPPKKKKHGAHHHGRGAAFDIAAIDDALAPLVRDERDRRFVIRCIVDEGPRHHRGASWALLRMLAAVVAQLEDVAPAEDDLQSEPVAIRLPPAVASASDDSEFPLGMPTRLLRELLTESELATALEALRDGPAHHALANAAMAALIERIERRVRAIKAKG